jgi:hypothetical protein
MEKERLAGELRRRQYRAGMVEKHIIDALSDDDIIDSYVTCSHCGKKHITAKEQAIALRRATTADQFFAWCDTFASSRQH